MAETEKRPEEPRARERTFSGRSIFLIIAAFVLGFLLFYALDNADIFLAGQVQGDEWERINSRIVERSCLEQARQVAVSEGYSKLFVIGCSCLNVQSDILKTFDCNVNTIDVVNPSRKVLVHCYKTSSQCTIASDRGLETYNFSDLEQYIVE